LSERSARILRAVSTPSRPGIFADLLGFSEFSSRFDPSLQQNDRSSRAFVREPARPDARKGKSAGL
jgi:hypothetical protein